MSKFYFFTVIYFAFNIMETFNYFAINKKFQILIKCMPILSLIAMVYKKFESLKDLKKNNHGFKVFLALLFSVVADALLVFDDDVEFFLAGLGLFLMAAIFYIQAFGWKKVKLYILPITFLSLISLYYIVFEKYSTVPPQIKIGCLIYTLIGQTAIWRAWARVEWEDVRKGQYKDLLAAIGVISFASSDLTLAINKFCFPIHYSRYIVMTTYYFAQYAISSAVQKEMKEKM